MEKVRQNGETFVDANREHLERVLSDFEPLASPDVVEIHRVTAV
jgi:hypothetical protein